MDATADDNYPLTIRDSPGRINPLPVQHTHIWHMYKEVALPLTWFATDITKLDEDKNHWDERLGEDERRFLEHVLAFFAGADKLVAENISTNFITEIEVTEAQAFYAHQAFIENIHAETYGLLIQTYVTDERRQKEIFDAVRSMPVVRNKAEWALRYSNRANASFAERLVAFAIVEGVFFSASFAAIYYFRGRDLLPGLCLSNEYISRDEGLHCTFACLMYSYCKERLTQEHVHRMFADAVETEREFVCEAIPVGLIGLSSDMMVGYVRFVADFWLKELGYEPLYGVANPLDYMAKISLGGKANFFEEFDSSYSATGVEGDAFTIDESF